MGDTKPFMIWFHDIILPDSSHLIPSYVLSEHHTVCGSLKYYVLLKAFICVVPLPKDTSS